MLSFTTKPEDIVTKTSEVAVKSMDFGQLIFKESMKFFNDITDKAFYTYTVQATDAINKVTEYAKEAITTQRVPNIFEAKK